MPLFPACTTGNTMLIGIDAHSTAIPPVPLNPHPFIGVLMLWTSPKFPMTNVMIAGSPACCSGAKGYSIHIPQGTWVDIPKVTFKVWYITNLITVAFATLFTIAASIMIGIVKGLAASLTDPKVSASKQVWDNVTSVFQPFTQWQTWAQMLIPPMPLPGAEGNVAIGSPTVSVSGGSMALGIPLGGASCSEIPIVPNASVIAFSHVMVGMTFAELLEAFVTNAITGAAGELGKRAAGRFIARFRCRLGLEPIDLVTGSNFEDKTDFELNGPLALTWKRYYASTLDTDGPLGWNWSHEYQRWLEFQGDSTVYHNQENRSIVFSALVKDGDSHLLLFERLTLTRVSATEFTVKGTDGMIAFFTRPPKSDRAWIRRLENRAGEAFGFRYDPKGRLHEIIHSTGQRLIVDTQKDGRITKLSLACSDGRLRALVGYEYDDHGDLVAVIDAAGKRAKYIYDDKHQMTRKTDRNGYSFHYVYDRNGRCIKSRGDDDLYAGEIEYMPPANITIMTAPSGGKYIYRYDKSGLVTSIMDPYGSVQLFEYDAAGNKVAEVDEMGHATKYKYDPLGNVVEETNALGGTTKRKYNEINLKVEETDPDGNTCRWEYDLRGNLQVETAADGGITRHVYDERNRRVQTTDARGNVTKNEYSDGGLLNAERTRFGAPLKDYQYDDYGRMTVIVVGGANRVRFTYDSSGRLTRVQYPDGSFEESTFDGEGNAHSFRDRGGRAWYYRYRSWNQLAECSDPQGGVVRYAYDRGNELVAVADPNGHKTAFGRDLKDRVTKVLLDDVLARTFEYDRSRNIVAPKNPLGEAGSSRTFGPMGRKIAVEGATGVRKYAYDPVGRLVSAETEEVIREWEYDPAGRLTQEKFRDDTIHYKYNREGRFESIAWSEGLTCTFTYSRSGALLTVQDPAGGQHQVRDFDQATRVHIFPNDLIESWSEHSAGEGFVREMLLAPNGAGRSAVFHDVCQFDRMKNLTRRERPVSGKVQQFRYDGLDRLTEMAELGQRRWRYQHDAGNNLALREEVETTFGPGNRLESAGVVRFVYDQMGNLLEKRGQGAPTRHEYNADGQLTKVISGDGTVVTFGYDATGCRAWKEHKGGRIWYHWAQHRLQREILGDNHRRVYVYLSPETNAPFMFVDLHGSGPGPWAAQPTYLHSDYLGVPQLATDKAGGVAWEMKLQPYGDAQIHDASSLGLNLRYPGRYHDPETGLDYNGYRYYDPDIGRFIQPDPVGLRGGLNLYAGPANPLRDLDLMGTSTDCSSTTPANAEEGTPDADAKTPTPPADVDLHFGPTDLVYGPSHGGDLRGLQEAAGGQLLTDLGSPPEGMSWTQHSLATLDHAAETGQQVHFDTTHMSDMDQVLAGTGRHDPQATNPLVTSSELRHIRDNYDSFETPPKFYHEGREVPPPWTWGGNQPPPP